MKPKFTFAFKFGLLWEGFTVLMSIPMIGGFMGNGFNASTLFVLLFFALFHIIGIFLISKGIGQYKKDRNTALYGTEKFAFVKSVTPNGNYRNNSPEYDGIFEVFDEDGGSDEYKETLGFNPSYAEGDCVKVLHYEDDINVLGTADLNDIPENIKQEAERFKKGNFNGKTTVEEEVIINGQKFVKKG